MEDRGLEVCAFGQQNQHGAHVGVHQATAEHHADQVGGVQALGQHVRNDGQRRDRPRRADAGVVIEPGQAHHHLLVFGGRGCQVNGRALAQQGRPGDALEYTAASGGAAFILGPAADAVAVYQGSYSYVTDTPDFWRRSSQTYPSHGDRFTGEPAYFDHTMSAAKALMEMMGTTADDYAHAVFHQPNVKFPSRAAAMLGFKPEQIQHGLLSGEIGNVYSGSSMIGLTAILDVAQPGDRILMISYGSGAGSDAFDLV
ncbi:MAG: hydroxymethylglutaryl-CoA synthase [Anaerolineae bacterium]|nr:hydroxymethylglutaryl-CoA synthase [Anaerolineae bacterium]